MSELQCVARLKIHDGKLDEFKRLAAKCAELVRTKDTGTLQDELYFNSDNTECPVFERYRDSQALLDHHKNLGDTMAAILQTCSGSLEICGTPSPELIEQLKDSLDQVYTPFLANWLYATAKTASERQAGFCANTALCIKSLIIN